MSDKKTILVIDDEVDLQQLMKIALRSRGYRVETANNGVEGLEILKKIEPHLIILDLNMPKMGGLAFYQNICDRNNQPKYSVFILTARANMAKLFQDFIIDGFKTKPFEVDELLDEIDAIINKKFGIVKKIRVSGIERAAKVCIVDNEPEEIKKIGDAFLNVGYVVNSVANGVDAIEYIYGNLPDVVLIKLALPGISGDAVIVQLKRMARTQHIKFILYTKQEAERTVIIDRISTKSGIDSFIQYLHVQQLVNAANQELSQYSTEE
ncbi:MAG: response regulator [Candidatus Omnitrophica bacterium]|nr:response regulator [Candidatus Omnitrophota bacterium]MDE2009593.1 response regulator [Candidatus Omnitrophota bacterium]MDE2214479.1 response regulator [Candidatus Omnitrophota bacterium]MDE2231619.1 response regulator [Candidatus Omnitrophota bacterium]